MGDNRIGMIPKHLMDRLLNVVNDSPRAKRAAAKREERYQANKAKVKAIESLANVEPADALSMVEPVEDKRQLPTVNLRNLHARLLISNPTKAAELWEQWARVPVKLRVITPKQLLAAEGEAIAQRIEHRREVKTVNSQPLKRRV